MSETETISSAELSALTGLTDRRHRQIADLGYMAPPDGGRWPREETISGLFKYYREHKRKDSSNLESEKIRKTKAEADLVTAKVRAIERKHVPIDAVLLVWEKVMLNLRAKIMSSGLNEKDRRGILDELQPANLDEYFAGVVIDDVDEGKSEENE